jgi:hypothetical protein
MRLRPGNSIFSGRAFRPQPRTPEVTLADRAAGAGQPKRNLGAEWLRARTCRTAADGKSGRSGWALPLQEEPQPALLPLKSSLGPLAPPLGYNQQPRTHLPGVPPPFFHLFFCSWPWTPKLRRNNVLANPMNRDSSSPVSPRANDGVLNEIRRPTDRSPKSLRGAGKIKI